MPGATERLQAAEKSKPEQGGGSLPRRSDRAVHASVHAAFYRLMRSPCDRPWLPGGRVIQDGDRLRRSVVLRV